MAVKHICDRCGSEITSGCVVSREITIASTGIGFPFFARSKEICGDCASSFKDWWKQGEERGR